MYSLDDIVDDDTYDLKYVIDQYYDLEDESNDIHCLDSKYVDPDDLKDMIDSTTNFQNCKYSCIHINIRSIPDKINKLKLLLTNLESDGIHFDFILLCETFLSDRNCNTCMYNINGYNFVGKHRQNRKCGGVGIYIRNSIHFKLRKDLSTFVEHEFESIFIEVSGDKNNIVFW